MLTYFWIMIGGAFGTGARFWASGLVAERFGEVFPLGTLVVNVSGSFVIGFFAALTDPAGPFLVAPRVRQFVMIGLCGGYTTFSSFSLQTLDLARDGDWLKAGLNSLLSFICCLVAVWLGRSLALMLLHSLGK
jgi:CrcB protein